MMKSSGSRCYSTKNISEFVKIKCVIRDFCKSVRI